MSREVTIYTGIAAAKGGAFLNTYISGVGVGNSAQNTYDMSGSDLATSTQSVSESADAALSIPAAISPVGVVQVENLDATNYIELSTGTGGSFSAGVFDKIGPGLVSVFHPQVAIYAKANTAACLIQISAVEGALTPSA